MPRRSLAWWLCCSLWLPSLGCGDDTSTRMDRIDQRRDAGAPERMDASSREAGPPGLIEVDEDAGIDAGRNANADKPDAETGGCGDGRLQPREVCDDGNDRSGDGCSADCTQRERDYVCPAPGQACVSSVVCGDGRVSGRERCDDGNLRDDDGCDRECKLEAGYRCSRPGALCTAAECGDGVVAADEQCEDDNDTPTDGDGCSAQCRLEPGWVCDRAGAACREAVCNDGVQEGGEPCDDGNTLIGDGCTPFCEVEPDCSAGACRSRCGDGLLLPNSDEECDDGNLVDRDGCSSKCKREKGFVCEAAQAELPDVLAVPVTYRDFIALPVEGRERHPDFELFVGSVVTEGLVQSRLGTDGKPVYAGRCDDSGIPYPELPPNTGTCPDNQQLTTRRNFDQWYRDTPSVNVSKIERMPLSRDPADGVYRNAYPAFFPWDGDPRSWVRNGQELEVEGHNYGFTSELHTYFEYTPDAENPPTLSFTGDDDVWVFINRTLAVDIGGMHTELERSVTLDAATAERLQLEAGNIYELALFQAERHSTGSHFNLSLEGFVSGRSVCEAQCGDGVVAGRETCDDSKNDSRYDGCTKDCQRAAHCGDGKRDQPNEACDDGINITTYSADGKAGCAPGCVLSAYCGDGEVDSAAGEACDDGKNTGAYGRCGKTCQLGPRCGDGTIQSDAGETCDDANQLSGDGCSQRCELETPD
ncbi:MAG: DUF4215 domain-containing protein [Polyangiales bacterium]